MLQDWNSFYNTLSNLEICFPNLGSTRVAKLNRSERELPLIGSSVPPILNSNTTGDISDNVTISVMADVHVLKSQHSLFGVTLHTVLPAAFLGIKSMYGTQLMFCRLMKYWYICSVTSYFLLLKLSTVSNFTSSRVHLSLLPFCFLCDCCPFSRFPLVSSLPFQLLFDVKNSTATLSLWVP